MERLLQHIDRITSQRDRTQLEAALAEALHELLGVVCVRLYKVFLLPGDILAGQAVEVGPAGMRIDDDGLCGPAHLTSIDAFPLLDRVLKETGWIRNVDSAAFPIVLGDGHIFGGLVLEGVPTLGDAETRTAEALVAVFRNCLALLDYCEVDTLTTLLNRKTFDESLLKILSRIDTAGDATSGSLRLPRRRQPHPEDHHHWLAVMDIDHFKRINDAHGHLIGDEVLLMVANRMRESFRFQDKLFRFGGEEFVVLLTPTSPAHALATFERFRQGMAARPFPQVGQVTISIGFARIHAGDTASLILDNADRALYWAKENGRDRVGCYELLCEQGLLAPASTLNTEVELF